MYEISRLPSRVEGQAHKKAVVSKEWTDDGLRVVWRPRAHGCHVIARREILRLSSSLQVPHAGLPFALSCHGAAAVVDGVGREAMGGGSLEASVDAKVVLCLAWHKERGAGVTILVEAAPVQPSACQLTTPVPRPASPAAADTAAAAAAAAATLS